MWPIYPRLDIGSHVVSARNVVLRKGVSTPSKFQERANPCSQYDRYVESLENRLEKMEKLLQKVSFRWDGLAFVSPINVFSP